MWYVLTMIGIANQKVFPVGIEYVPLLCPCVTMPWARVNGAEACVCWVAGVCGADTVEPRLQARGASGRTTTPSAPPAPACPPAPSAAGATESRTWFCSADSATGALRSHLPSLCKLLSLKQRNRKSERELSSVLNLRRSFPYQIFSVG